jgi:hypothetical protein
VPRGRYRVGCAALGFDYVEVDEAVAVAGAQRDFALQPESHPGRWDTIGDTLPETLDATDMAVLLPDGRILYCHDTIDPILFDPLTGAKGFPSGSGLPQGCMNTTLLEDGRAILIGGQDGADPLLFRNASRLVKVFALGAGWTRLHDLLNPAGRWYPGLARLVDGRLLVMGGGTRPNAARTSTCEVFDQASGTWTTTGSMGQAVEFPPAALLHTGRVLRTWGGPELYDPATGAWSPTGPLAAPNRGWPGHADHSLGERARHRGQRLPRRELARVRRRLRDAQAATSATSSAVPVAARASSARRPQASGAGAAREICVRRHRRRTLARREGGGSRAAACDCFLGAGPTSPGVS